MQCGTTGYASFVEDLPLFPSVRTLQRSIQFIKFESGLISHMFDLLETYANNCSDLERDCHLVVDELALSEGEHWDPSTNKVVGKSTFPTHIGLAKKGLVIMLAGILKRWKVSVAVFFTSERAPEFKVKKGHHDPNNWTGKAFLEILLQVVARAESIKLRVSGITSDMGADNQAVWRAAGVKAGRKNVTCCIPNSARPASSLYFLPDVVHVFKSIKAGMEQNEVITLHPDIVKEENLPTVNIDYNHVQDLYEYEEGNDVKVAFRLKPDNIKCTNQYNKMRTATSRAVICHRTGVGLNLLAEEKQNPSYRTTAWFIILLNTFFELLTGRSPKMALCPSKKTMYDESIKLIKKVDRVFQTMKVGKEGHWKPFQTGVRLLCAYVCQHTWFAVPLL